MLFCSKQFVLFFLAVFLVYWMLPWQRVRVWLLLGASFAFYVSWNKWLAVIVCVTTVLDYLIARRLELTASPRLRKLLLLVSLSVNLGILCYFKYANFFLHSLETGLRAAGAQASLPVLQVILPLGISFYTFEAISYTIDVYRRRIPAERNLAHFMLFILFFPHLIAGPIVRARDFLPQVGRRKRWSWGRLHLGLGYFALGMFKKLAIADRMALYADPVFTNPAAFQTSALWTASVAFAVQIYCDFSGYSDMALGTAHMLGYKLAQNFDLPLAAPNISEFWRRWHMSLSRWLRDYLFIPLGGSRGSRWQTCRNLMIVMIVGGLWHGASWTSVTWGILQGSLLSVHRLFRDFSQSRPRLDRLLQTLPGTVLRVGFTFLTFTLCCIFLRVATVSAGGRMLKGMFAGQLGVQLPLERQSFWLLLVVVVLGHALARNNQGMKLLARLPAPVRGLSYAVAMTLALLLVPEIGKTFIYFQF
jgi:alginate O-acetyltransferase complex protein AlgI